MALISRLTNLFSGSLKPTQKIREIFFNLIQNNQGSITEIDLAMAANISGTEAKKYLEQFAVEFDATFDVTEKGHVVYLFPIGNYSDRQNDLNSSQDSLSRQQNSREISQNHQTSNISQNSPKNNQTSEQYLNSSSNKSQIKLDDEVANLKKNLKNTESEIKTNIENIDKDIKNKLKNVENDLKNVGDSLNNIFK